MATRLRWLGIGVGGLAGFLLIAYAVLKLAPDQFAETESLDASGRADARQGVRTASLALLAGLVGVIGAIYTGRTFALNRAGQLTDRFTKAIEQLASKALDVRLGGIYALERIARDSKEDHPQVFEVLTAYVREHARRSDREHAQGPDAEAGTTPDHRAANTLDTDVQAVLTVAGRRNLAHEPSDPLRLNLSRALGPGLRLNFSGTSLPGAKLQEANLSGVAFARADLRGANFSKADLKGAHFSDADLRGAHFIGAQLRYAIFTHADLRKADFRFARNLANADLSEALYNRKTYWPDGFEPTLAGAILFDEEEGREP